MWLVLFTWLCYYLAGGLIFVILFKAWCYDYGLTMLQRLQNNCLAAGDEEGAEAIGELTILSSEEFMEWVVAALAMLAYPVIVGKALARKLRKIFAGSEDAQPPVE